MVTERQQSAECGRQGAGTHGTRLLQRI
jgi:hypothetical protein